MDGYRAIAEDILREHRPYLEVELEVSALTIFRYPKRQPRQLFTEHISQLKAKLDWTSNWFRLRHLTTDLRP